MNVQFQTSISDEAETASKLVVVETRHALMKVEVNALQAELNDVVGRLRPVKENLNELRPSVLQRSLAQTWQHEKLLLNEIQEQIKLFSNAIQFVLAAF